MADLKTFLARNCGPGCLAGITLGNWLRLLAENSFAVHPLCLFRAGLITASSSLTSLMAPLEWALFERGRPRTQPDPVFILGSWRSGTTHLHNLMSLDQRFGCPNLYQTMYPHTFRLTEPWFCPMLGAFTPKKRFMDNMVMGLKEPAEDEMALAIMSLRSNMLAWTFTQNPQRYERCLSFADAPSEDKARWQRALLRFTAKVEHKLGLPLVLKSPNHTARIRAILEVFPNAKFLHIRRNPFSVYQSLVHMATNVTPVWTLQRVDFDKIPQVCLDAYKELYRAYFEQLPLIPPGQFHEIPYEDLVKSPIEQLHRAYAALNLPDFAAVRPRIESYLAGQGDYQRNKHAEIPAETRARIASEWKQSFDAWGYPTA